VTSLTVRITVLAQYADEFLRTAEIPDYPNALNGLQFENRAPIARIAAAVDFSSRTLQIATRSGANLLVVHHGMFWGGLEQVRSATYRRYAALLAADMAVYASHLPLDCHPAIGNNVLLAKELGLDPSEGFAQYKGIFIGVSGQCDIPTPELQRRANVFAQQHGGRAHASLFDNARRTRKWAICTGAGASAETIAEARAAQIDTLIVGEGAHWTAIAAEENELAIIYAGHYATETTGVRALAKLLGERYDVPWEFVNAPTGL
jgi:dinuclear metal center YbgI/SA1388 family protein